MENGKKEKKRTEITFLFLLTSTIFLETDPSNREQEKEEIQMLALKMDYFRLERDP